MDLEQLMAHTEALIFASDRPLTQMEILDMLKQALEVEEVTEERVATVLEAITDKYKSEFYPFGLCEVGGGFQFLTKRDYHKTVLQLNGDKFIKKLSGAAMETLAIIAYKQPITKSEIEYIRGVSADYSIQKLLEKDLIVISGRNEQLVGKPLVYATSKSFMDYLGIRSSAELPQLKDIINTDIVIPTEAIEAVPADAQSLEIDEEGSLIHKQAS